MHGATVGDPRFYARRGPFGLQAVALAAGGDCAGPDRILTGIAPLAAAGPTDVTFLNSRLHLPTLQSTRAGAVIVHPDLANHVPTSASAITVGNPDQGWAQVADLFHPIPPPAPGIHPTACVADSAEIHPGAQIDPFALVQPGARIGAGSRIGAYACIGEGVVIGPGCRIGPHTTVSHAVLGLRVCLHPGARIGQEGFGFSQTASGFVTAPQLGRVLLEDDVEVGANATIDRGSVQDTIIGAGTRIDNLVQIGHNVRTGRCCVIVAQVGISGSTVLEDFVQIGGQAAFAGHLRIGRGAQVGAQAGVIADVPPGAIMLGSPAQPKQDFFRQIVLLKRMLHPAKGKP